MIAQTYSAFGSVKALKIIGDKATRLLQGEEVRTALKINSTHFILTKAADGSFVLLGLGYGHALGMSQWGAYNLAKRGVNYLQILGHYYQGIALSTINPK